MLARQHTAVLREATAQYALTWWWCADEQLECAIPAVATVSDREADGFKLGGCNGCLSTTLPQPGLRRLGGTHAAEGLEKQRAGA